jgi:hypothetical protein
VLTSPGQHGDSPRFIPLMEQIRIIRRGLGRPRRTPGAAMADKAYSSAANRAYNSEPVLLRQLVRVASSSLSRSIRTSSR